MKITSRPYSGLDDLAKMKALQVACKRVYPYTSIHRGDLDWWLFYDTTGEPHQERIRLWLDENETLLGWAIKTEAYSEYDMAVHPDWRGTALEREMLEWGDQSLTEVVRRKGGTEVHAAAYADNAFQIALLEAWGYRCKDYLVYFAQPLDRPIPQPALPEGFTFLPAMQREYAELRADVHASSFNPSRMTGAYYAGFMQAPDYDPWLDTVVVAPDGQFASFVMGWVDNETKIGVFEPVGTRNIMQRKGLGRAALYEGMRRLQARGMTISTVGCNATIQGNLAFYRSAGYEIRGRLLRCTKTL